MFDFTFVITCYFLTVPVVTQVDFTTADTVLLNAMDSCTVLDGGELAQVVLARGVSVGATPSMVDC